MTTGYGSFTIPRLKMVGADASTGSVFTIPLVTFTGTGGVYGAYGTFNIPLITSTVTGSIGEVGSGTFTIPIIELSGNYYSHGTGTFNIPLLVIASSISEVFNVPVPILYGTGSLSSLTKTYQGIVMNIANKAISTYQNFNFNSLVHFNGKYFGANSDGIHLLGGRYDTGQQIQSKIKIGPLNFGNTLVKYIRDIWLTYRSDGHLCMVIYVDEDQDNLSDEIKTQVAIDRIHEEKLPAPKGMRGRYYTIELTNKSGADFDIDSINFLVDAIQRKKR